MLLYISVKNTFLKYPVIARFILAAILFVMALFLAGFINKYISFPFTGVLLLALATWILYKTENKNLKAIGLDLQPRNLAHLFIGLLFGVAAFVISTYSRTLYTGEQWHITPHIEWLTLVKGLYLVLPTVATQQLIFRGYPYKKTVEVSNVITANIIWGLLFACYHDIWGNLVMLPLTILSFLISQYVFGTSLLKSFTLYLPIGIHLGHNWSSQYFNGYKPSDVGIFYITDQNNFNSWEAFFMFWFTYNLGFIILAIILWRWKGRTQIEQVQDDQSL
jgi:hypothetical protein